MATETKAVGTLTGVGLAAAITVIAVWLGMLGWLVAHTDATEVVWARWLMVLASLEAVAFAAAGAVFGTAVQRQRVADAKVQAAEAEGRATKAEQESKASAANGHKLKSAIKAWVAKAAGGTEAFERVAARPPSDQELVALAERLFPD